MQTNVIIVDNFYNNVDATRNFILTNDFKIRGNYPGARTESYANDGIKQYFEKLIGKRISYFLTEPNQYNGSYQYTTKDMKSWIHRDCTEWAGVVYLTPNAPANSGTGFFRHIQTGLEEVNDQTPKEIRDQLDHDSNDMSKWEMIDYVGNKYNRLVLFRGTRSHRSMEYFGNDRYDGRLFQVFFFNEDHSSPPLEFVKPKDIDIPKPISKSYKLTVIFFTTSRYEFLIPTLESFHKNVNLENLNVHKILIDDYPLRRDIRTLTAIKDKYKIDNLILNPTNLGYSSSWKTAWEHVPPDTDYIWHQEDDFTFNSPVEVIPLIKLFETSPITLNQICLKRQVWFPTDDFIQNIETGKIGTEFTVEKTSLILHQTYFNSNPCIYPISIIHEKYEHNPQEHTICSTLKQKYPDRYSAIYGKRNDPPLINHIGEYNQGKKVNENEPGWSWLKNYDPDKKYYSKEYLKIYNETESPQK